MVKIFINDLKVSCVIGTKEEERKHAQELILNISFDYDAKEAIEQDDLNKAVDYQSLSSAIIKKVKNSDFFLIETLADEVLKTIFLNKKIMEASLAIEKPGIIGNSRSVCVKIKGKNT